LTVRFTAIFFLLCVLKVNTSYVTLQIGAWVSRQSSIIESRNVLIEKEKKLREDFDKVRMPENYKSQGLESFISWLQNTIIIFSLCLINKFKHLLGLRGVQCQISSPWMLHFLRLHVPKSVPFNYIFIFICLQGEKTLEKPDFWGGYRVLPDVFEFWQGQSNRLHDRLRFRRQSENEIIDPDLTKQGENGWIIERLSP